MIPSSINIHKKSAVLELVYDDQSYALTAEYLRVFSPSAEVQGHSPSQAVLQHGKKDIQFKDMIYLAKLLCLIFIKMEIYLSTLIINRKELLQLEKQQEFNHFLIILFFQQNLY